MGYNRGTLKMTVFVAQRWSQMEKTLLKEPKIQKYGQKVKIHPNKAKSGELVGKYNKTQRNQK